MGDSNKLAEQLEKIIKLDNKGHVGGITLDEKNGILFVTGAKNSKKQPEFHAYDYKNILTNSLGFNEYTITKDDIIKGLENLTTGKKNKLESSSIVAHNGTIFAGNYNTLGTITEVDYDYDHNHLQKVVKSVI